jgi:hypothetical protein
MPRQRSAVWAAAVVDGHAVGCGGGQNGGGQSVTEGEAGEFSQGGPADPGCLAAAEGGVAHGERGGLGRFPYVGVRDGHERAGPAGVGAQAFPQQQRPDVGFPRLPAVWARWAAW